MKDNVFLAKPTLCQLGFAFIKWIANMEKIGTMGIVE
jgi:hypothetical protein